MEIRNVSAKDIPKILEKFKSRPKAARSEIGSNAFAEACKGLSRAINPSDKNDIETFAEQLRSGNRDVVAENSEDVGQKCIVLALSYVHHNKSEESENRFKFSDEQWEILLGFMRLLSSAGVKSIHFWYDQSLWLRDSNHRSWPQVGILPYAIWPVLSLGTKRVTTDDRTIETETRYWPFVEELTSLWGAGMFITKELRSANAEMNNVRHNCSYNSRETLAPEHALKMILLNIFHGAGENLETKWLCDREELQEMARKNVLYGGSKVYVGPDWRARLGARPANAQKLVKNVLFPDAELPTSSQFESDDNMKGVFLDGAKKIASESRWNGILEFLSGNRFDDLSVLEDAEMISAFKNIIRFSVLVVPANKEYQLLRLYDDADTEEMKSLWLLVKMVGKSIDDSKSSNGKVEWCKVIHGSQCPGLRVAIKNKNNFLVREVLKEQSEELREQLRLSDSRIDLHPENQKELIWTCVGNDSKEEPKGKKQLTECPSEEKLIIEETDTTPRFSNSLSETLLLDVSYVYSASLGNMKSSIVKRKKEDQQKSLIDNTIERNKDIDNKRRKLSNLKVEKIVEDFPTRDSQHGSQLPRSSGAAFLSNLPAKTGRPVDSYATQSSIAPDNTAGDALPPSFIGLASCTPGSYKSLATKQEEEETSAPLTSNIISCEKGQDQAIQGSEECSSTHNTNGVRDKNFETFSSEIFLKSHRFHLQKRKNRRLIESIDFGCCTYKSGLQLDESGHVESCSFDLSDDAGTIHVCAFKEAASYWSPRIRMGKFYSLRSYSLKIPATKWKRSTSLFEMTLDMNSCLLEHDKFCVPFHLNIKWNFTKIAALENLDRVSCDLIGLVDNVKTLRRVVKDGTEKLRRVVTIVDDSWKIAEITLWGEHAEKVQLRDKRTHPVLLITNAMSGSHNLSLDITFEVGLEVQPSYLAEADKLRDWAANFFDAEHKSEYESLPMYSIRHMPD